MTIKLAASSLEGPFYVKAGNCHDGVRKFTVPDLAEASSVCRRVIEEENLGSDWRGGQVVNEADGTCVAVVSYNGRVWAPGGRNPEGECVPGNLEFDLDA